MIVERLRKKARAVRGNSKLSETGEDQDQGHVHNVFDFKGIVYKKIVLANQTVKSAYYSHFLRQKNWLVHHGTSFLTRTLLTKN
jgi:hypothetical protein